MLRAKLADINKSGKNCKIKKWPDSAEGVMAPCTDDPYASILPSQENVNHSTYLQLIVIAYSTGKRALLASIIKENSIDIVMGCESHLDESYLTSEVFPSNFTIYRMIDELVHGGVLWQ